MLNAGELKDRIEIQAPISTPDGLGGFTTSWLTLATVWAKKWTASSSDQTEAMQQVLVRVTKFKIRYRRGLRTEYRVKAGSTYYSITGIDPDAEKEALFLTCKEVTG
jgi:SPP1 family predicted phage head-tail adaptor